MKTLRSTILLATAALALITTAQASDAMPAELSKSIRLERYFEPIFPLQLRNTSVTEGYAQVQLLVAADGSLLETFISAYSHPEFCDSATQAIRGWVFRPVDASEANKLPQRYNLRFNFRHEGMIIVSGDFQETVNAFLKTKRLDRSVSPCKLRDLDNIPEALNLIVPTYPTELKKQKVEGAVSVSFFIDEDGRVRVPNVDTSTRPEFATAALEAVSKWTFVPPQRKGQATRVLAVQDFNFRPEVAVATPSPSAK